MKLHLKDISRQVIVITGASSGIGLATARAAAARGARTVLAARNVEALESLAAELQRSGADSIAVPADVTRRQDLENVAAAALGKFGGFDTWVNNAAVAIYGRLDQVSIDDQRRLFDVNYWGVVYGSLIAAQHLRAKGGAIINIGSVLSDRAIPLQSSYGASKHAVKAFTDGLRMELEEEGAPISVTLVKPSTIDTPYIRHAKNYLDVEPVNPPPVYDPRLVADAILHCARHPRRDIVVGFGGKLISASAAYMPRVTDKLMEAILFDVQKSDIPKQGIGGNLYGPGAGLEERGGYPGRVRKTSLYTQREKHPLLSGLVLAAAAIGLAAGFRAVLRGTAESTAS